MITLVQILHDLVCTVQTMRQAQKNYFTKRDTQSLLTAKHWEKEVDDLLTSAWATVLKEKEPCEKKEIA